MSQSSKVFLEDCFCVSSSLAATDYTHTSNRIYSLFIYVCDFYFTFGSSIGELQAEKTSYEALTGYASTHHLS